MAKVFFFIVLSREFRYTIRLKLISFENVHHPFFLFVFVLCWNERLSRVRVEKGRRVYSIQCVCFFKDI